jgi:hypothetical protein
MLCETGDGGLRKSNEFAYNLIELDQEPHNPAQQAQLQLLQALARLASGGQMTMRRWILMETTKRKRR